jgi:hypothetical protein
MTSRVSFGLRSGGGRNHTGVKSCCGELVTQPLSHSARAVVAQDRPTRRV